jgi:hypothetical protein
LRHLRYCRQLSGIWRQELNARCKPGITPVVSQNVHGCKSRLTRPQPGFFGYSRASCKDAQKLACRLHRHPPQVTPCWPVRGAEADTRKGGDIKSCHKLGKEKLTVSKRTIHNHFRRLTQLYEQKKHQPNWKMLLDDYRRRWVT